MKLRKADRAVLEVIDDLLADYWDDEDDEDHKRNRKAWSSFFERVGLDGAKAKQRSNGISVKEAIKVFQGVLGKRLVLPAGNPSAAWFIALQNRLNQSGVTAALAAEAAKAAGAEWRGPIKAESIIRQCDTLLSEASVSATVAQRVEAADMEDL